jgi:hypothetical protein
MATRPRRFGVLGTVCAALLVVAGVVAYVRFTGQSTTARRCAGGAASPAAVGAPEPLEAIRRFAPVATLPAYLRPGVGEVPDDGWVRRSDTLFEHNADGNRVLQLDVAASDGQYQVVGVWVCSPVPV